MDRPEHPEMDIWQRYGRRVNPREASIDFDVSAAERHASAFWTDRAGRYGFRAHTAPPKYLQKYVNEIRVYGLRDADARLAMFTRTFMTTTLVKNLMPGGFMRIEPNARGVLLANVKTEVRHPDLRRYARQGLLVLVLGQGEPPMRGMAEVYVDIIHGELNARTAENEYTFTKRRVGVTNAEEVLRRQYLSRRAWILGDSGTVVSIDDVL